MTRQEQMFRFECQKCGSPSVLLASLRPGKEGGADTGEEGKPLRGGQGGGILR